MCSLLLAPVSRSLTRTSPYTPVYAPASWPGAVTYPARVIIRDGPVAPWRQIADLYRRRIQSGELPPGSRLPSIAALAQEYEVAMTTAQKVIQALRSEGLAVTSPMGTYVAESPSPSPGTS